MSFLQRCINDTQHLKLVLLSNVNSANDMCTMIPPATCVAKTADLLANTELAVIICENDQLISEARKEILPALPLDDMVVGLWAAVMTDLLQAFHQAACKADGQTTHTHTLK